MLNSDYYTMFKEDYGLSSEKAMYFQSLHYKFYAQHRKYSQDYEVHCRVTWLSKKAAQFKFDEDIAVGEDTLHMFELKNQAVLGNLKFYTTDETPATYVYDERTAGTVMSVSKFGSDYEWMDEYLNKLQDMEDENKLHENVKLPELKVENIRGIGVLSYLYCMAKRFQTYFGVAVPPFKEKKLFINN